MSFGRPAAQARLKAPTDLMLNASDAGKPIHADCTAGGVAPELNELLNGEDAGQVFHTSAILGMASFQLIVGLGIPGDPTDMSDSDDIAVYVRFQNAGAAGWAAISVGVIAGIILQ